MKRYTSDRDPDPSRVFVEVCQATEDGLRTAQERDSLRLAPSKAILNEVKRIH
jgi:hypothetical protein